MIRTQYYNIRIEDLDVTQDLEGNLSLTEEDGKFTVCSFALRNSYAYLDLFVIGNKVSIVGGLSRDNSSKLFVGYVNELKPSFKNDGNVMLDIKCMPFTHSKAGLGKYINVFPSEKIGYENWLSFNELKTNAESKERYDKEHENKWDKESPLKYSYIIKKMAEASGYKIKEFSLTKGQDLNATHTAPLVQNNETNWSFMKKIADKINASIWEEPDLSNDNNLFFCKSNNKVVNALSNTSFYFVAIKGFNFSMKKANKNMIRLKSLDMNLAPQKTKSNNKLSSKTNPETGKTETGTDKYDEKTDTWTTWVLDEEALERETPEKRKEVKKYIEQCNFRIDDWSVIAPYFKKSEETEKPSQEPYSEEFEVENSEGDAKIEDKQYRWNNEELGKVSAEERASIIRGGLNKELSDEDFAKYFKEKEVEKEVEPDDTETKTTNKTPQGKGKKQAKTKKRDDGFTIKAKCNGDNRVKTKRSYIIEGIGKYSDSYYLYRIQRVFNQNGYEMMLTFTK